MECAVGYTVFDNDFTLLIIQEILVEGTDTICIHFKDPDED